MSVSYKRLWKMLIDKDINKSELIALCNVSPVTLARMGKNQPVSLSVLDKVCIEFDCEISDVVEIIKK